MICAGAQVKEGENLAIFYDGISARA
jgi:hypothetical protein